MNSFQSLVFRSFEFYKVSVKIPITVKFMLYKLLAYQQCEDIFLVFHFLLFLLYNPLGWQNPQPDTPVSSRL